MIMRTSIQMTIKIYIYIAEKLRDFIFLESLAKIIQFGEHEHVGGASYLGGRCEEAAAPFRIVPYRILSISPAPLAAPVARRLGPDPGRLVLVTRDSLDID